MRNNSGLTLTELIVSSVLIGIVMTGVAAFSFAVKGMQNSSYRTSSLYMQAATTMAMLRKDASLAVGNRQDMGFRGYWSNSGGHWLGALCIRHDSDGDPTSYTNDKWRCYFSEIFDSNASNLYRCPYKNAAPTDFATASCNAASRIKMTAIDDRAIGFFIFYPGGLVPPTPAMGDFKYLELRIRAVEYNSGVKLQDTTVFLNTNVVSLGHSW